MKTKKFVIMARDELGDIFKPSGEFFDKTYEFPDFDENDEIMLEALWIWIDALTEKANKIWQETHDSECVLFVEEKFSSYFGSMSIAQMEEYADIWF